VAQFGALGPHSPASIAQFRFRVIGNCGVISQMHCNILAAIRSQ
jgi:hypothetical protein